MSRLLRQIVTASDDGHIKVWAFDEQTTTLTASLESKHPSNGTRCGLTCIGVSPKDFGYPSLFAASEDGFINTWRLQTQAYEGSMPENPPGASSKAVLLDPDALEGRHQQGHHFDRINQLSFNTKAMGHEHLQALSCSDDGTAIVWDAPRRAAKSVLVGDRLCRHRAPVSTAEFNREGTRVLTASHDRTCIVWHAASGTSRASIPSTFDANAAKARNQGHTGPIWSAHFSDDSQAVVTASKDKTAKLWDAATQKLKSTFEYHTDFCFGAAFSPHGNTQLMTWSIDGTAALYDVRSKSTTPTCVLDNHVGPVWQAKYSANPTIILTCSHDMTAMVWDQRMNAVRHYLFGHRGILWQASFSNDQHLVLTASEDRTARLWNIRTGGKRPPSIILQDGQHRHDHGVSNAAFVE
mmetsp:Transcript_33405/g.74473  ORF Transcript_33405/g.74473 Transcript_33405/m.74473 type:complete len:409 (+) Transcript_33405:87-1313(+)